MAEIPDLIIKEREEGPLMASKGGALLGDGLNVEYSPKDEMLYFEFKGKRGHMTKLELWQFVFSICDPKMREQIMPIRSTEVTTITKVHAVAMKKDMKRGEIMKVRCHMNVETSVVEALAGLKI